MDSVLSEFESLAKKQKTTTADTFNQLDSIITRLENTRNELQTGKTVPLDVRADADRLVETHKSFFSATSKFSKWIEKQKYFKTDMDSVWDPKAIDGKEQVLNKAIALHFVREGKFALSDKFKKEASLELNEAIKSRFMDMYQIVQELKDSKLESAIEWCRKMRNELETRNSSLEFQLHKAKYVSLVKKGEIKAALSYAKSNFSQFKTRHATDIQKLMTAVLFAKKLEKSPYRDLFDASSTDLVHQFTRNFCQLLGLSSESPLYTSITVGASALPVLIKMSSILKEKSGIEWTQDGELAVEIPLLDSQRFHSVFSCPVSKEQATDENPAMLMACGHVIVKESLNRLSKGNNMSRFKCPYCPQESTAAQALQIYF